MLAGSCSRRCRYALRINETAAVASRAGVSRRCGRVTWRVPPSLCSLSTPPSWLLPLPRRFAQPQLPWAAGMASIITDISNRVSVVQTHPAIADARVTVVIGRRASKRSRVLPRAPDRSATEDIGCSSYARWMGDPDVAAFELRGGVLRARATRPTSPNGRRAIATVSRRRRAGSGISLGICGDCGAALAAAGCAEGGRQVAARRSCRASGSR